MNVYKPYKTCRLHKKAVKHQTCLRRRMIILSVAVIASVLWIFAGSGRVSAHDNHLGTVQKQKCYKSIEIVSGDTLWNIAETYMDDDYDSVQSYIKELKQINGLHGDQISEGRYLMVSYYEVL